MHGPMYVRTEIGNFTRSKMKIYKFKIKFLKFLTCVNMSEFIY